MFSVSAEYYDALYSEFRDYDSEVAHLEQLLTSHGVPPDGYILDVACGTGEHLRRLAEHGYAIDGVDCERAMLAVAQRKVPTARLICQDMMTLELNHEYHAVMCLFSSIGYVRTLERLRIAIRQLLAHTRPGGVVVVEPWYPPGELTDGFVMVRTGEWTGGVVSRVSRTCLVSPTLSVLEFGYLVGTSAGIEYRSERHELGLFARADIEEAFVAAGADVTYLDDTAFSRGLYVGVRRAEAA